MRIVNKTDSPVHVKLLSPSDEVDFITVMPKRQVTVPEGFEVDPNWAVLNPLVRIIQEA